MKINRSVLGFYSTMFFAVSLGQVYGADTGKVPFISITVDDSEASTSIHDLSITKQRVSGSRQGVKQRFSVEEIRPLIGGSVAYRLKSDDFFKNARSIRESSPLLSSIERLSPDFQNISEPAEVLRAFNLTLSEMEVNTLGQKGYCKAFSSLKARGDKYQVLGMLRKYSTETIDGSAHYLSAEDVEKLKVSIQNGMFFDFDGKPLTVGENSLFVMDSIGNFYVMNKAKESKYASAKFRHSSFFSGKGVAAAGQLQVTDGKLVMINNASGHYRPDEGYFKQALSELQAKGVVLGSTPTVWFYEILTD